jgi:hypothetical protein
MRPFVLISAILSLLISSWLAAETPTTQEHPPQTARQALIEMCFGQAPGHFEKHLPAIARQTFSKLGEENGQNFTGMLSAMKMQTNGGGEAMEIPSLHAKWKGSRGGNPNHGKLLPAGKSIVPSADERR